MSCGIKLLLNKTFEQQKSSQTGDQRVFECTKRSFDESKVIAKDFMSKNVNSISYDAQVKIKFIQLLFLPLQKK